MIETGRENDWIKYLLSRRIKYYDYLKIYLHDLFKRALHNDQVAFVKLFLDHDFSLTDFFRDQEEFVTLYKMDQYDVSSFLRHWIL